MTLTAKWALWTATIYYDKNAPAGVSVNGSMSYDTFDYGTAKNLSKNTYFANGYKFIGWNTKPDGTGTAYGDEASFIWRGSANNENRTLYAQWCETKETSGSYAGFYSVKDVKQWNALIGADFTNTVSGII